MISGHLLSTYIRFLSYMFFWKSWQKVKGLKIFIERAEFSYSLTFSSSQTRFLSAINLGQFLARSGNSHQMLFIISQKEKSATVRQPKYQSPSLQFFYISISFGCIFSSQQNQGDCWGNLLGLQLLRLSWQMRAMMLSLMSCLLLNMSSLILSLMELPKRESWLALRMRYSMMPCWPVTTKLPSLRKGRPLMIQSLASLRSQLSHSSGVKKRSLQASPRYSQSKRQTCALARIPKQPITTHSSFSSRFIHNNTKKLFETLVF